MGDAMCSSASGFNRPSSWQLLPTLVGDGRLWQKRLHHTQKERKKTTISILLAIKTDKKTETEMQRLRNCMKCTESAHQEQRREQFEDVEPVNDYDSHQSHQSQHEDGIRFQ